MAGKRRNSRISDVARVGRATAQRVATANAPIVIVDGFLPGHLALAMRRDIDAHFTTPEAPRRENRQVWDYASGPEHDAYLQTDPARVIGSEHVDAFHQALRAWSWNHLGMAEVIGSSLHLYVAGCRQTWRTGLAEDRFGFVYSLTRNERRTAGGETLIVREGDPLRAGLASSIAERGLHEVVEPRFNRLVIFDARLAHAVERVEGPMGPAEGCFVLRGHLREGNAAVVGALSAAAIAGPLNDTLGRFGVEFAAALALYQGPLMLRLTIGAAGAVDACDILVDRVIHLDPGHVEWDAVRADLMGRLKGLKFPPAGGRTVLTQPVLFGNPAAAAG
jgi:hypothetical protein